MVDTVPMTGTATMKRMTLMLIVSIWRTNTFLQVRTPSDLVGCCLTQSPGSRPRKVDFMKKIYMIWKYITYIIEFAGILGEMSWVWVEILMMAVVVIIVATKQR